MDVFKNVIRVEPILLVKLRLIMKPLKTSDWSRTFFGSSDQRLNRQNAAQGELPAQHAGAAVAPP